MIILTNINNNLKSLLILLNLLGGLVLLAHLAQFLGQQPHLLHVVHPQLVRAPLPVLLAAALHALLQVLHGLALSTLQLLVQVLTIVLRGTLLRTLGRTILVFTFIIIFSRHRGRKYMQIVHQSVISVNRVIRFPEYFYYSVNWIKFFELIRLGHIREMSLEHLEHSVTAVSDRVVLGSAALFPGISARESDCLSAATRVLTLVTTE